jgi:hypothetical protein
MEAAPVPVGSHTCFSYHTVEERDDVAEPFLFARVWAPGASA